MIRSPVFVQDQICKNYIQVRSSVRVDDNS